MSWAVCRPRTSFSLPLEEGRKERNTFHFRGGGGGARPSLPLPVKLRKSFSFLMSGPRLAVNRVSATLLLTCGNRCSPTQWPLSPFLFSFPSYVSSARPFLLFLKYIPPSIYFFSLIVYRLITEWLSRYSTIWLRPPSLFFFYTPVVLRIFIQLLQLSPSPSQMWQKADDPLEMCTTE
jgi:hypothetical protein